VNTSSHYSLLRNGEAMQIGTKPLNDACMTYRLHRAKRYPLLILPVSFQKYIFKILGLKMKSPTKINWYQMPVFVSPRSVSIASYLGSVLGRYDL
jgi:hypothetical protein